MKSLLAVLVASSTLFSATPVLADAAGSASKSAKPQTSAIQKPSEDLVVNVGPTVDDLAKPAAPKSGSATGSVKHKVDTKKKSAKTLAPSEATVTGSAMTGTGTLTGPVSLTGGAN